MPYRITFKGEDRIPTYNWTENAVRIDNWKKGFILDEILIQGTGRNIYNKAFRKNIIYKVCDYGILEEKNRIIPLEVVIIHDTTGRASDVAIPGLGVKRYYVRNSIDETFMAIVLADIQYKGTGGIVYSHPFHRNKKLQDELRRLLSEIKK